MQNFTIHKEKLDSTLKRHKLSMEDYKSIQSLIGRDPNIIELGIFSAMWSEHCSYKSSKIYLKGFPTKADWVLQGPGENAGVIDIGDNLAAVFKMESHNHPSFIEPNAGAATGVGGILRDIFTMGANPVANLNSIRFGNILDPSMKKKHIHLLHGVVEGIGHYGNCMGIPTIGGETSFESCYNGNILVNTFSLGIVEREKIFYGRASGDGNPVIYVGSKTGRDGLGGAVMSSDSFSESSKALRPTVQIGDPFVEKLLLDACLEIFNENLIIGIQDMGAAGLTSSSFEMASRSKSGMIMWLDKIPMRESGMNPYELMLSESQERMLICAKKGCENRIKEIFAKYDLSAEVVGKVTDTGRMELLWHDKLCANLEIDKVVDGAPILQRDIKIPSYLSNCKKTQLYIHNKELLERLQLDSSINIESRSLTKKETTALIESLLSSLDICDKSWIYNQYDSTIKANTIKGPGLGGSSIISLKQYNSRKALSMSAKCNVRYCYLNARVGAKIAVATSGRKVALSGARPLAITDCLNFGSPENPEVMHTLKEACEGIKEASKILQTPVISGNVSLYNQTNSDSIYPTPSIVSVGLLDDYSLAIGSHFVGNDSIICRVGGVFRGDVFSGSLLQKIINSPISGEISDIDLSLELRLWDFLIECVQKGWILSARDIGVGGIAMTLCKMSINSNKGCKINKNLAKIFINNPISIFSEEQTQVICEIDSANIESITHIANSKSLECEIIGRVTNKDIDLACALLDTQKAKDLYFHSFEDYIKI